MTDLVKYYTDLVKYYRAGGPCEDFNDVCRHRLAGCPCTETADRIEELERDNRNRGAAVVLAQEYLAEKDKRIEELEARMERIADRAESLGEAQWIAHNSLAALEDQT